MADEQRNFETFLVMAQANAAPMTTCLMACLGWLGYYLSKHGAWPSTPKFFGGLILSVFMGFVLFNLLTQPTFSLWWWAALASLGGPAGAPLCKSLVHALQDRVETMVKVQKNENQQ